MILQSVTPQQYQQAPLRPASVYASAPFAMLNSAHADTVRYIVGLDHQLKARMGIILGLRGHQWLCPFSAPYGEVSFARESTAEDVYDFIAELKDYLGEDDELRITLPPLFRPDAMLQKSAIALGNMAHAMVCDSNYHYPLAQAADYEQHLRDAAPRNLRRALASGFAFSPTDDAERVYSIIQRHYQLKGYPLRMSLSQVVETARLIPTDYFIVTLGAKDGAAAVVQHVAPGIVQLIYWSDAEGFAQMRPMNFLAYALCHHYAGLDGLHTLDFGPASSAGIPATGLCRFKESIGCLLSIKPTFTL